jgi:hypothetical protein
LIAAGVFVVVVTTVVPPAAATTPDKPDATVVLPEDVRAVTSARRRSPTSALRTP